MSRIQRQYYFHKTEDRKAWDERINAVEKHLNKEKIRLNKENARLHEQVDTLTAAAATTNTIPYVPPRNYLIMDDEQEMYLVSAERGLRFFEDEMEGLMTSQMEAPPTLTRPPPPTPTALWRPLPTPTTARSPPRLTRKTTAAALPRYIYIFTCNGSYIYGGGHGGWTEP